VVRQTATKDKSFGLGKRQNDGQLTTDNRRFYCFL
jgi:hypothetical protein